MSYEQKQAEPKSQHKTLLQKKEKSIIPRSKLWHSRAGDLLFYLQFI
jgi:hypothetical protein